MKVDITDILSIENKIVEQQVLSDLAVFKSKLGEFSITKKHHSCCILRIRIISVCLYREKQM